MTTEAIEHTWGYEPVGTPVTFSIRSRSELEAALDKSRLSLRRDLVVARIEQFSDMLGEHRFAQADRIMPMAYDYAPLLHPREPEEDQTEINTEKGTH